MYDIIYHYVYSRYHWKDNHKYSLFIHNFSRLNPNYRNQNHKLLKIPVTTYLCRVNRIDIWMDTDKV